MRHSCPILALLIASTLWVQAANGQSSYSEPINPPWAQVTDSPSTARTQHDLYIAQVVFIGTIENAARLAQQIGDLLRVHGITARFEQRAFLSENELIAQRNSREVGRATVWILVPSSTAARLVFADVAHQKFLVRDIPLLFGLDDFGRESVGQVVESSLLALLQGASGVSRTEARSAMGQYLIAAPVVVPAQPIVPAPAQAAPLPSVQLNQSAQARRWLTQRLGLGYGVNMSGSAFGVEQGPVLVAGAELIRQQDSLFATVAFDWHFAQHYQTSEFDLSIQSSRIWLLFGWRKPIDDLVSFVATLGPGLSVTRVSSTSNAAGLATPWPSSHDVAPWARLQSGLEWGNSPLVIQLLLTADASFFNTQYDITRNGINETLAHPWFVRPGAALGVLWR